MKLLLDMDGVIVNFTGGLMKLFPEIEFDGHPTSWDIHDFVGVPKDEMWRRIDAGGADFWANLAEFPWTDEVISLVESTSEWFISTSPSLDPSCSAGKLQWLHERFGRGFTNYFLGSKKWMLAKPHHVLIDDSDNNVELFRGEGGRAILFPQPWNKNRHRIDNSKVYGGRVDFLRDKLEKLYSDSSVLHQDQAT